MMDDVKEALRICRLSVIESIQPIDVSSVARDPNIITPSIPTSFPPLICQALTRLKQSTTGVALSFKPPLTESAAIGQLQSIDEQFCALASCVTMQPPGYEHSLLIKEWRHGICEVRDMLLQLLDALNNDLAGPPEKRASGSRMGDRPYLAYTGMVWEAIDEMIRDLSTSENEAAIRAWKVDDELVKDAWRIYKEAVIDKGDDYLNPKPSDEWEDPDEMISPSLNVEELAFALAKKRLMALYQLLHGGVQRWIPSLAMSPERSYFPLISASHDFTAAFDDAVDSMNCDPYNGEELDEETVEETMEALDESAVSLVRSLRDHMAIADPSSSADAFQPVRSFLEKWEMRCRAERESQSAVGGLLRLHLGMSKLSTQLTEPRPSESSRNDGEEYA